MSITVIPAYGRDYTSAKAAIADWNAGKDFIVASMHSPYAGKYVNRDDAAREMLQVMIRYAKLTKITEVPCPAGPGL